MALVSLNNAHFDFGREKILRGVSVSLHDGVKCALVGANGAGKTTLLAALEGQLELPAGVRQVLGSAQLRMLKQDSTLNPDHEGSGLLIDVVGESAFAPERRIEVELNQIASDLASSEPESHPRLVARQGQLQSEFERLDGYTMQSRLETALRGVGLFPESWQRPVAQLSGGERRRAALATVLLSGADLLLLDEPTNHLDLDSCEWLEGFLIAYPGAAVIVSHDRQFLDRVTTRTLHLERGRLLSYSGNYSFFHEQSKLRYEQDFNAWQRQQTKVKQTEEYIRRNIEGQKTKQAQARRKQLAKEVRLEKPSTEPGLFRFRLEPVRPSGGTVIETDNLSKGFGQRMLMDGLDLHVSRGDRLGIVGPNGCGKSTLLKLIAGREAPDTGRVVIGHNVDLGFYDQELGGVSDHHTVIAEMAAVDPRATQGELRSFLGAFGFGEDLFDRQVGKLSGGERGRLSLLRLIKEGHNTLLLDEPTNHLDVRSRESLEAALADFSGTMVVVSHDRRFLDKLVDRLIVFPGQSEAGAGVRLHLGNYADYVRTRDRQKSEGADSRRKTGSESRPDAASSNTLSPSDPGTPNTLSKNEISRRRKLIEKLEEDILRLETEKAEIVAELVAPELDNAQRVDLSRRCSLIDGEMEQKMAAWEDLSLEIEKGTEN